MLLSSCRPGSLPGSVLEVRGIGIKETLPQCKCWDRGIYISCGATRLDAYRARLARTNIRSPLFTEGSPSPLLDIRLSVCPRKSIHICFRIASQLRRLSETVCRCYFSSSSVCGYHKRYDAVCQGTVLFFACISERRTNLPNFPRPARSGRGIAPGKGAVRLDSICHLDSVPAWDWRCRCFFRARLARKKARAAVLNQRQTPMPEPEPLMLLCIQHGSDRPQAARRSEPCFCLSHWGDR